MTFNPCFLQVSTSSKCLLLVFVGEVTFWKGERERRGFDVLERGKRINPFHAEGVGEFLECLHIFSCFLVFFVSVSPLPIMGVEKSLCSILFLIPGVVMVDVYRNLTLTLCLGIVTLLVAIF